MQVFLISDTIRIRFLSKQIIHCEYSESGEFFDGNTFLFPNITHFRDEQVEISFEDGAFLCGEYIIKVPQGTNALCDLKVFKKDKLVYAYKPAKHTGELPSLQKTPEVFAIHEKERLIEAPNGYAYVDGVENCGFQISKKVQSVFLLLCNKDMKLLRNLFVQLTGKNEMVRLSTFGSWNSKYCEYNDESARQVIKDYQKYDIPLDNLVLDTDWRKSSAIGNARGIGYDINSELFPDFEGFIAYAHSQNVEIMLNDHPEPVEGTESIFDSMEIKYRSEKLTDLLKKGVDTWWYDRNWHTKLKTPFEGIPCETLGMYAYESVTRNFYFEQNPNAPRRPVIMANVSNIYNSVWKGIQDTASHRYSIQWTGDTVSDDFKIEVENLVRCGNHCIPYVNSDCGGHLDNPNKYTYLRWVQFCVFSPVFRPHCQKLVERTREPWVYDREALEVAREYIKLRYRLLPLLYKSAYENYLTGLPICQSMGFVFPTDRKALTNMQQFMIGEHLLIAPIVEGYQKEECVFKTYLPKGEWIDVFDGEIYKGKCDVEKRYTPRETPLFVRLGCIIPLIKEAQNTKAQSMKDIIYDIYPNKGCDFRSYLYEDDGETIAYKNGGCRQSNFSLVYCEKSNSYKLVLEEAQGNFTNDGITSRTAKIKFHLIHCDIEKILINGEEIAYQKRKANAKAFPFSFSEDAADSTCVYFEFAQSLNHRYEVDFYLNEKGRRR